MRRALAALDALLEQAERLEPAIVGVMAANAFYLTMQQSYFYALTMLALALPVVFGRRLAPR